MRFRYVFSVLITSGGEKPSQTYLHEVDAHSIWDARAHAMLKWPPDKGETVHLRLIALAACPA